MPVEDWTGEYYYEEEDEQPNIYEEFRESNSKHWMLKDKTIVKMKDMTTSHIRNCLSMLEKADWDECKAYKGLVKELEAREENHG